MSQIRNDNEANGDGVGIGQGYGTFQIARALATIEMSDDAATRARAWEKIGKWAKVLEGMRDGTISVGARVPVSDVPAWATLQVVTGGFATGGLLAGGPLLDYERELLARLPLAPEGEPRRVINSYFLTEEGLAEMTAMVESGCYTLDVAEQGALPVVAWLARNGYGREALEILDELEPWFGKLRFYPAPSDRPRQLGSRVCLQDVGETIEKLRGIKPNHNILAQREAIFIWAPLYDSMVDLMLKTVDGEPPHMDCDADGCWQVSGNGRFPVKGGWPCAHYPDGWAERATELLQDYERLRKTNTLCGRPERPRDSFPQLREYLRRCIENPASLTGRDVGRIRLILARHVSRQGVPDSPRSDAFRAHQEQQAGGATFQELAGVVIRRLGTFPMDAGIDDIAEVVRPIAPDEVERWEIHEEVPLPEYLQRKVERALNDTVESLVERGIITSGETLARLLPRITSAIRAGNIPDPSLRQLYAAIYAAFRRRRSLLLLNLEKQVQIEELPWIAAIDRFREKDLSVEDLSRRALKEMTLLVITAFPQATLPNKLLQEFNPLAKAANIGLPLVEEVAADIFMGLFSPKFLAAAKRSALLLDGSFYAAYYGIDYQRILRFPAPEKGEKTFPSRTDDFILLCEERAGIRYERRPVTSGMILEQQQILTTQNLAVLYAGLDLSDALSGALYELARRCFVWICRRLQVKTDSWHAGLIQIKNGAYAWRQMIFFLSLIPADELKTFLSWAESYFNGQPAKFRLRFRPAMEGLVLAARGISPGSDIAFQAGARRFLGWSNERHWLLADSRS